MTKKKKVSYLNREIRYIKKVRSLNKKQDEYRESINNYPITFGIGPAGGGKTYLAVVEAVEAFDNGEVGRIVFVRPAVATENLGFLPGTYEEKLDPYLRPLFDAMCDRWDPKKVKHSLENMEVEIAALAFIRGRTFNNCFIVFDEAQNSTVKQMKMFLTRMGDNCTCVVTGDLEQSDLQNDNGLTWVIDKLKNCDIVNVVKFEKEHVVRSDIVKELLNYI